MSTWLYALECRGNRIYIGIARDPYQRITAHCAGRGAKFTRAFPPQSFIVAIELDSHVTAARLEYRLKQLPRSNKASLFRELIALSPADLVAPVVLPGIYVTTTNQVPVPLQGRVISDLATLRAFLRN